LNLTLIEFVISCTEHQKQTMRRFQFATLLLLVIVVTTVHCIFKVPAGEYTVEFVAIERTSPDIQQSFVANVKLTEENVVSNIHFISEDKMSRNMYEYSTVAGGKYVSYMYDVNGDDNNELKCRYATNDADVDIQSINDFVKSIQPFDYNSDETNEDTTIYDQQVHELLSNTNDYISFMGTVSVIQQEPLLIFVDRMTLSIKYILGEYMLLRVDKIQQGITTDVSQVVQKLRSGCDSLDNELEVLSAMKRRQRKNNSTKTEDNNNSLPWFYDKEESCFLPHVRDETTCGAFQQQKYNDNNKKVCVFLHGSGETEEKEPTNERKGYWGNVHEYTPQCSERWFIWANTKDHGWDNHDLQRKYCELAAFHNKKQQSDSGTAQIKNTIIFTHSLGNLILAASIRNKYCSLDSTSSSWYAVDSPYDGSQASARLKTICNDYHNHQSPSLFQKLFGYIAEAGGYCIPGTGSAYHAYNSVHPGYCDAEGQCIDDLEHIVVDHVKGAMCGVSPIGLISKYSVMLEALSLVVGYDEDNDGMVSKSSCERYHGSGPYSTKYKSNWYTTSTNHADGTCRNGDGWWNSSGRKPCSWYTDKY
jgi:hypothetical protein